MENSNINNINMDIIYKVIKANLKTSIIIAMAITVATAIITLSIPNRYIANVKLAPEYGAKQGGNIGSLGNAAAMFGINLGNKTHQDALSPVFYPEIIATSDFLIPLMDIEVETVEGDFKGTYSEYLINAQKRPWWSNIKSSIFSLFKKSNFEFPDKNDVDPFMLTNSAQRVLDAISSTISCEVDDKLNTIEIKITAQDPLVAATMVNVVKERLQEIITEYRTGKVKNDYEYSVKFCEQTHNDYITAQKTYADFVDKHQGVSRQAFKIEQERLQGEMQLAYSMYNAACQQRILAAAKLQEETPVFTAIQKASVPLSPSEPRRRAITIRMMALSFVLVNAFFIIRQIMRRKEETDAEG